MTYERAVLVWCEIVAERSKPRIRLHFSGVRSDEPVRIPADLNGIVKYSTSDRYRLRDGLSLTAVEQHGGRAMIVVYGGKTALEAHIENIALVLIGAGGTHRDHLLRGKVEFEWKAVDMQVLVKADGMPTYHLANVVDDHLMGITHVLRGEEWINSAPKHQLLYEYFGWEMPTLCHMPLLRNTDKSKISKRKNPTSLAYYERAGILPEALVNFLSLMGTCGLAPHGNTLTALMPKSRWRRRMLRTSSMPRFGLAG